MDAKDRPKSECAAGARSQDQNPTAAIARDPAACEKSADAPLYDLIELFFFAYRDFVGDADRLLDAYAFGRAHHRVLYFVARRPGLTIAELLDILKITKQSLNRVLKELLDQGFVEARAGADDRRQRRLYPTASGGDLTQRLARLQSRRFEAALAQCAATPPQALAAFFLAMADDAERVKIATGLTGGAHESG